MTRALLLVCLLTATSAIGQTISALTPAGALVGPELFECVQSGSKKCTAAQIKTWASLSPTLVTPTLGVATATSINGLTLTAGTGTLTLGTKTLTISDMITLATDGTGTRTLNIGAGGTLGSAAFTAASAYATAAQGATADAALAKASNLSDLTSASTARTNLGLGALSTVTPGTGVATALGVNIGSAGAPVLFNGAGGTPSSLTLTNATGLPPAGVVGTAATLGANTFAGAQRTNAQVSVGGAPHATANVTIFDAIGSGANPQIRLTGGAGTYYTDIRSDVAGEGDLFIDTTGSTVWLRPQTNGFRSTLDMIPKGSVAAAPANIELFSNDYFAAGGSTNYERLRIHSRGTSETAHAITSEKGGTGIARPIHIYAAGANGLYIEASGAVGVGTTTLGSNKFTVSNGKTLFAGTSGVDNEAVLTVNRSDVSGRAVQIIPSFSGDNVKFLFTGNAANPDVYFSGATAYRFDGSIFGTGSGLTGIPPAGVTGTAAVLGANTFTGVQTLNSTNANTGNLTLQAAILTARTYGMGLDASANFVIHDKYDDVSRLLISPAGIVSIPSTTDSTSTTTGALTTPGGIAAAKSITVGQSLNVGVSGSSLSHIPGGSFNLSAVANGGNGNIVLSPASGFAAIVTTDATINGLTVGRGGGNVAGNSATGLAALQGNTSGGSNVASGAYSLLSNTTGAGNTAIGTQAGFGAAGVNANTTGIYNTYVGFYTVGSASGNTNEIVHGANAVGRGSNTAQIGDPNLLAVYTKGAFVGEAPATDTINIGTVGNYVGYAFANNGGYWGIRTGLSGEFAVDVYSSGSPKNVLLVTQTGNVSIGASGGTLTVNAMTPASSGTRYLCISTAGVVTSSASACSGT